MPCFQYSEMRSRKKNCCSRIRFTLSSSMRPVWFLASCLLFYSWFYIWNVHHYLFGVQQQIKIAIDDKTIQSLQLLERKIDTKDYQHDVRRANNKITSKHGRFAYVFMLWRINPTKDTYRDHTTRNSTKGTDTNLNDDDYYGYYVLNVVLACKLLKQHFESNADILLFLQYSYTSDDENRTSGGSNDNTDKNDNHLPKELEQLLSKAKELYQLQVRYLPNETLIQSQWNTMGTMFHKFYVYNLTDYDRIFYMDCDVLPLSNLDYLMELSYMGEAATKQQHREEAAARNGRGRRTDIFEKSISARTDGENIHNDSETTHDAEDDNRYDDGDEKQRGGKSKLLFYLQPNVIISGVFQPSNGGFFIIKPNQTIYEDIQQRIQPYGKHLGDVLYFDKHSGWYQYEKTYQHHYRNYLNKNSTGGTVGHDHDNGLQGGSTLLQKSSTVSISSPSIDRSIYWETNHPRTHGTLWNFWAAEGDQGFLYFYTKYIQQNVTQIMSRKIVHYYTTDHNEKSRHYDDNDNSPTSIDITKEIWPVTSLEESPFAIYDRSTSLRTSTKNGSNKTDTTILTTTTKASASTATPSTFQSWLERVIEHNTECDFMTGKPTGRRHKHQQQQQQQQQEKQQPNQHHRDDDKNHHWPGCVPPYRHFIHLYDKPWKTKPKKNDKNTVDAIKNSNGKNNNNNNHRKDDDEYKQSTDFISFASPSFHSSTLSSDAGHSEGNIKLASTGSMTTSSTMGTRNPIVDEWWWYMVHTLQEEDQFDLSSFGI